MGHILGKEHSGRVRGVGDGVSPLQVFGPNNPQFFGTSNIGENKIPHQWFLL